MRRFGLCALALASASGATAAITWTDWTAASAAGVSGTMGPVSVVGTTATGGFHNWQIAGGFDFWRFDGVNPWPAYDGVPNLPPNNDFVAPNTGIYTFTFSSPVVGLYVAIISLGQSAIQTEWTWSQAFTLIDQGQGYWGNGSFTIAGNTIGAGEAHGIVRFNQPVTSLTLSSVNGEFWSGLTFGFESVVPEPMIWAMLIAGFGLVGAASRRRRMATAG